MSEPLSFEDLSRLDGLCDEFESQWREGQPPRIEDLLADLSGPLWECAFEELVALEVEFRRRAGERKLERTFAERFPDRAEVIRRLFERPASAASGAPRRPDFPAVGAPSSLGGAVAEAGDSPEAGRFRAVRPHARGGLGRIDLRRGRLGRERRGEDEA